MRKVYIGKFIDSYKYPEDENFDIKKIRNNKISKSYNLEFYVDDERGMVILKNTTPIERIVARMKYVMNKKNNVIGFSNNYIVEEKEKVDYQNRYEDYIKMIKYEA